MNSDLPEPDTMIDEGPFHLDYEEHLEPYVDGKADDIDREIVDSHVAVCSTCASELKDLLEFKKQKSVHRLHRSPVLWRPAWAAAAVLAAFILATAVFMWTRSRPAEQARIILPLPETKELPSPAPSRENAPSPQPSMSPREEPLLVLNDAGGQVIVNKSGRVEGLQELPPDLKESVERALATRRLGASPGLSGWFSANGKLRSAFATQSTFGPLAPVGVVIETDRPIFRWRPLEGSQHCTVTIYDAKLRPVASSGPMTRADWKPPNPLPRGVTYSWQISAVKDGETVVSPKPPLPEARFKVLDQRSVDTLAKLKGSAGSSHLALGVFYWKHGLLEESEREFQLLANANPNSTVVKELLKEVATKRHISHKQ